MTQLSELMQKALQASGMTARELAGRLGVDESTVSLWLSGQRSPRLDKLQIIADALGVKPSDLVADASAQLSEAQRSVVADMADMPDALQQAVAAMVAAIRAANDQALAPNKSFKPNPLRGSA